MAKPENPFEILVQQLSENLVKSVEAMPEQETPFGVIKLTADEQMHQYLLIRDDPVALMKMIQEQAGDMEGPAIPRSAIDYVVEMERRIENART